MPRAPYQVLVIPFRRMNDEILYCVFKRSDEGYWQWIAGGGEENEVPLDAAKREALEEAGIDENHVFMKLDSTVTIPAIGAIGRLEWGEDTLVIPEYAYAVEVQNETLPLSSEHDECVWLNYQNAMETLKWDSNRNALWELNHRLNHCTSDAADHSSVAQDRLSAQIRFVLEADKLKQVLRRSYITDGSRIENDAEHSWHLALMALLLSEYSTDPNIDLLRVLGMVLIHDLVEIDAGDTFLYDSAGTQLKTAREQEAAERIYALLPTDQSANFRSIWDEFEASKTAESKFARALDRLQPLLLNYSAKGRTWQEHDITYEMVMGMNPPIIAAGAPALESFVIELLNTSTERGYFRKPNIESKE